MCVEMLEKPMNLPKFLSFKKALKEELSTACRAFASPIKGKSLAQVVEETFQMEGLSSDQEVQELDVPNIVQKATAAHKQLKEYAEKTVALWRFSSCKGQPFKDQVRQILEHKASYFDVLEDLRQVGAILKELKAGLKRQVVAKRRQDNHKVKKVAKMLQGAGGRSAWRSSWRAPSLLLMSCRRMFGRRLRWGMAKLGCLARSVS